jgi:hypothetical protein
MKLYWPQHKVFFVATLALFPERLKGHEVNQLFYQPFFAGDDPQFIEVELADYRKAGYLEYEKPKSLFKITDVDTEKAKKDLLEYLGQWQRNELIALSANKPPDAARQKELLLAAIIHDHANHKNGHRITLADVYGKQVDYRYKPPFWELILSYQLLDKKIKTTYMDYDRREDGLYDDGGQPTVDFKIIDKELLNLIEQQAVEPPRLQKAINSEHATKDAPQTHRADIGIANDRSIFAKLDGKDYRISRSLRANMPPHSFINHVMSHPRTHIGRADIKIATGSSDITELVRACGFDRRLKMVFFPGTTEQSVYFNPSSILDTSQQKLLATHKWNKVGKV